MKRFLAVLAVAGLAVSSCSSKNRDAFRAGDPESTSTVPSTETSLEDGREATVDPCALLTVVEVGSTLGHPVSAPLQGEARIAAPGLKARRGRVCDFRLAQGGPEAGFRIRLAGSGGRSTLEQLKKIEGVMVPVASIGDEAVWQAVADTLWLRVGDRLVTFQVVLNSPQDHRAMTEGLARLALGRI